MKILTFILVFSVAPFAATIVESISGNDYGTWNAMQEYTRTITTANGTSTTSLKFRIYRYGTATTNLPFVVQVHEWGGGWNTMEPEYQYCNTGLAFAAINFQFANSTENQSNWWYGNVNNPTSGTRTVPWIHNAIIAIVRECMTTNLVQSAVGATIDTNRIYCYGGSIGGTGAHQLGMRHPEIFAAYTSNCGWTRFDDDNPPSVCNQFSYSFQWIVGQSSCRTEAAPNRENVFINVNADLPQYPAGDLKLAYKYTNLAYYLDSIRDPSWPTTFAIFSNKLPPDDHSDYQHMGDNIQPVLERQKRGYMYVRGSGTNFFEVGIVYMHNFRRDQSFLAFTNRSYGLNALSGTGTFNNISSRGWDHTSIVDEANHYYVKLSGTGIADVTLRRLQNLVHTPGTVYNLEINGVSSGQIIADQYGLVTIPNVINASSIDLVVQGSGVHHGAGPQDNGVTIAPNPFNPAVTISVGTRLSTPLQIKIYDMAGRFVDDISSRVVNGAIIWDASARPSGIYLIKIGTGTHEIVKRATLLK